MFKKLKEWYRDWRIDRKLKKQEYVYIVGYVPKQEMPYIKICGVFSTWEGAAAEHKRQVANAGIDFQIVQYPVHKGEK
jgi:hypothetical protein